MSIYNLVVTLKRFESSEEYRILFPDPDTRLSPRAAARTSGRLASSLVVQPSDPDLMAQTLLRNQSD